MDERSSQLPSATILPFLLAGFFALVFITFGAAVSYGFSTLDDSYLIVTNLAIRGITFDNLHRIFTTYDPELYIPLTLFTYQLNYLMTGLDAVSFHATNIVLHGANAILVSWLLLLITKRRWMALLGGLIFAVHPIHTEAVVWAAGRKDLLSTFFFLASLIAYIRYSENLKMQEARYKRCILYLVSLCLFFLGLLSKVMVFTLPITILLYEFMLTDRPRDKSMITDKIPYLLAAFVLAAVALFGKGRVVGSSTLLETVLVACRSIVFYLQKFFVPFNFSVIYPQGPQISLLLSVFFVPVILIAVITTGIFFVYRWHRWPAFVWCFYLVTLAPTFLNFHKGEYMYFAVDRYAYLPSIAIILFVLFAAQMIIEYSNGKKWLIQGLSGLCILAIVGLASRAYAQTRLWASDETLFAHSLALYPYSMFARTNLASFYRQTNREDQELSILKAGLAFGLDIALYDSIGSVYARRSDYPEAESYYMRAMEADHKNPEPYFFLGSLREQQGKVDDAIKNYQQAIALDDSYVGAHNNLAGIYQERGDLSAAETEFRKALSYNADFFEGQYNLFQILEMQRKYDEAFPYLERAYKLNPDDLDILQGIAYRYAERGRKDEAAAAAERAQEKFPDSPAVPRLIEYLRTKGVVIKNVK